LTIGKNDIYLSSFESYFKKMIGIGAKTPSSTEVQPP